MTINYQDTLINIIELTMMFKEQFNCDLWFNFVEDKIEVEIYSGKTCNRWYMFIEYQFGIDDVINEFKEIVVRDTLKAEVEY